MPKGLETAELTEIRTSHVSKGGPGDGTELCTTFCIEGPAGQQETQVRGNRQEVRKMWMQLWEGNGREDSLDRRRHGQDVAGWRGQRRKRGVWEARWLLPGDNTATSAILLEREP